MKNLIGLVDAIFDVYDNPDLLPKDNVTFCNVSVWLVAEALGYRTLTGKTADDIMKFIEDNEDWSDVPLEKVQDMANAGSLIIAGLTGKELNQDHGHVVVVRPGIPCYSGKWGKVPRVLNVGSENFVARAKRGPLKGMAVGVNESFVPLPKFYVWRPSL